MKHVHCATSKYMFYTMKNKIMKKEVIQYYKDRLKGSFFRKFSGVHNRVKTGMQSILLELKIKNLLPEKINAIEMFGMHALWHTMDYIEYVSHLDIFEIDKTYHELSKIKLKKYPVKFYNLDSIKYIQETELKYNFIVADIPFGGTFYDPTGLPYFFDQLIKISDSNGVIIFNCHSVKLKDFEAIKLLIHNKIETRKIKDLFFTPRNELVTYITIVME